MQLSCLCVSISMVVLRRPSPTMPLPTVFMKEEFTIDPFIHSFLRSMMTARALESEFGAASSTQIEDGTNHYHHAC